MSEQTEARPSYIDAILSTEFNECSIAAADAANIARNKMANGSPTEKTLQVIGELDNDAVRSMKLVTVAGVAVEHPAVIESFSSIVLTEPKNRPGGLGLGLLFNEDMLLPLATFEKRTDGTCSYIQIGQEMEDDNFVVTTSAARMDYVEEVRKLLNSANPGYKPLLSGLIQEELDRHISKVETNLPLTVSRLATAVYSELVKVAPKGARRELAVIRGKNEREVGTFLVHAMPKELSGGAVSSLGSRGFELMFMQSLVQVPQAQPKIRERKRWGKVKDDQPQGKAPIMVEQPVGQPGLYLLLRGDVALPIAEFTEAGNVFSDELQPGSLPFQRALLQQLQNMHAGLKARSFLEALYTHKEGTRDRKISVNEVRRAIGYDGSSGGTWDAGSFRSACEFADDMLRRNPFRLKDTARYTALIDLLGEANAAQRVIEALGEDSTHTERLVKSVGGIATSKGVEFEGVLPRRKVGKTVSDIDVHVRLTKSNFELDVEVTGRPRALEGFDPVPLFTETLSTTSPNVLEEGKARELLNLIMEVCTR